MLCYKMFSLWWWNHKMSQIYIIIIAAVSAGTGYIPKRTKAMIIILRNDGSTLLNPNPICPFHAEPVQ